MQVLLNDQIRNSRVEYTPRWLLEHGALFKELKAAEHLFKPEVVTVGKRKKKYVLTRKTCAMTDVEDENPTYSYAGKTQAATSMTPLVRQVKARLLKDIGEDYNYVLINWYPDGDSGIGWHQDDETDLVPGRTIASVSLGQPRRFQARLNTQTRGHAFEVTLAAGSLLLMMGDMQQHYKHCVPKNKSMKHVRLNLTFRKLK
jgi:alkylated DNA repair dioxygenase AlkB